ncbi:MAG: flavoprotein, partial [Steroidobacteraceae bacterium]
LVLLADRGWDSHVILSPTAATWVDVERLAEVSGHPVRVEPRTPHDPDPLPAADAIITAPLTFNSLNKWAAGISDTLALGLLNEALGLRLPITAAPCVKEALRQHPAYDSSVETLVAAGVTVLDPERAIIHSQSGDLTLDWPAAIPLLQFETPD